MWSVSHRNKASSTFRAWDPSVEVNMLGCTSNYHSELLVGKARVGPSEALGHRRIGCHCLCVTDRSKRSSQPSLLPQRPGKSSQGLGLQEVSAGQGATGLSGARDHHRVCMSSQNLTFET